MSEEVNLEVTAGEGTLLIKYTGENAFARQARHFDTMEASPWGSGCEIKDGHIVLSGFPNTRVECVNGRYQIRINGKVLANRLRDLLSLPKLELRQPNRDEDIWVVDIGANFHFDDWFDSIMEVPLAATSLGFGKNTFLPKQKQKQEQNMFLGLMRRIFAG